MLRNAFWFASGVATITAISAVMVKHLVRNDPNFVADATAFYAKS